MPGAKDLQQASRRGWAGWLRTLGLATWQAPELAADPLRAEHVILVGDDRELTTYLPGAKGSTGHATVATPAVLTAVELLAGPAGARVVLCCNSPSPVAARVFPTALGLGAAVAVPINWSESDQPQRRGASTINRGTVAVLPSANATHLVTGFVIGPFPEWWVPPGHRWQLWSTVVNVAITWGVWVTEHSSPASGELT